MRLSIGRFVAAASLCSATALGLALSGPADATAAATGSSTAGIKIVRIYFDSPGSDNRSNTSLNAEWVQIKNVTKTRKTLGAWTLRDASSHVYHFPATTLRPGYTLKVHTGRGSNNAGNRYWDAGNYIWNNTGDRATLRNAGGIIVSRCAYTKANDPSKTC